MLDANDFQIDVSFCYIVLDFMLFITFLERLLLTIVKYKIKIFCWVIYTVEVNMGRIKRKMRFIY